VRHHRDHRKLGRTSAHRRAMLRNLVTSLLEHEEVRTTTAKAKEVRRVAERMITLGKRGTLDARRHALRTLRARSVAAKLFDDLAARFRGRKGGYTRIVKLGVRRNGDSAEQALIQLVDRKPAGEAAKQ
jgi:large subunit ribosomal protein L17